MNKVCSKTAIWIFVLMLVVSASVLSAEDPPVYQDQALREARQVTTPAVPPALHQAVARPLAAAASFGTKAIPKPPTGTWGIVSAGDGGGGIFRDSDSEAEAWLGSNGYGVEGFGIVAGGYFKDSDSSGYAYVGYGEYGIQGFGKVMGGYFADSDGTGYAYVGYGNWGIEAYGNSGGGYFEDSDQSGFARIGFEDYGVWALGNTMGAYFEDSDSSGYARIGFENFGIQALGNTMGAYFADSDGSGLARVGYGDRGIEALGSDMGGYFKDSDSSGYAHVGFGSYGIQAFGDLMGGRFEDVNGSGVANVAFGDFGVAASGNKAGGFFFDADSSATAYVGYGDRGIEAQGSELGGYFADSDGSGYAKVGDGDYGIRASGNYAGGYFNDMNTGGSAYVGFDTYKISGTGAVSFVQNHPYDLSSVIVYAAPEGDEVATYTRGMARLVEGEATVQLGETFKWVTNPDIGLTVHLTPIGDPCVMYVVEKATNEITVRSRDGSDCAFDYLVYGLRIGFEELSIVQEKEHESYIPSMSNHRQLYERRPDLMSYNSLERFKGMHHAINPKAEIDLSEAHALRDAIIEFDPAVHEPPGPPRPEEINREDAAAGIEGHGEEVQGHERIRAARTDQGRRLAPGHSAASATIPVDDDGNVYATSFRPSSQDLASLVDVSEEVQPGDVLVIDRDNPGMMRKAFEAHDTGVIGVVALNSGVVLGTQPPTASISSMRDIEIDDPSAQDIEAWATRSHRAAVGLAGVVTCKVDAAYGAVWPGDLLVTSPTPGHAMRADAPLPGTMLGKALESLQEGAGTIKVLAMLR